jgi:hypothetical protein
MDMARGPAATAGDSELRIAQPLILGREAERPGSLVGVPC